MICSWYLKAKILDEAALELLWQAAWQNQHIEQFEVYVSSVWLLCEFASPMDLLAVAPESICDFRPGSFIILKHTIFFDPWSKRFIGLFGLPF